VGTRPTDEELLLSSDPEAFGAFYARHLPRVERYFTRRVNRDDASDLAAETFASALVARKHFLPGETPAIGWLYTIAARRLVDFQRRAIVKQRTLDALAANTAVDVPSPPEPAAAIELTAGVLRHLPRDQRSAILAHVLGDRDYRQVASDYGASEAAIRQRVSRGLSTLRGPLRLYRAAHVVAAQGRGYRFGGGHGKPMASLEPREALDCSSSASLILFQAGVFDSEQAWPSIRLAEDWGQPGEGQYVTLWANDGHVWLEFKLDSDHGERFDPTPVRSRPDTPWIVGRSGPRRDFYPRHWPDF
jgi:RNA polymerase sigma-70 factor (ECF subfamily)